MKLNEVRSLLSTFSLKAAVASPTEARCLEFVKKSVKKRVKLLMQGEKFRNTNVGKFLDEGVEELEDDGKVSMKADVRTSTWTGALTIDAIANIQYNRYPEAL